MWHALCFFLESWLFFGVTSRTGGPDRFFGRPAVAIDFNHMTLSQVFVRDQANGPPTTALTVGGAIKSSPLTFLRLVIATFQRLVIAVHSKCRRRRKIGAWALAEHLIQAGSKHHRRIGVHLGPK